MLLHRSARVNMSSEFDIENVFVVNIAIAVRVLYILDLRYGGGLLGIAIVTCDELVGRILRLPGQGTCTHH